MALASVSVLAFVTILVLDLGHIEFIKCRIHRIRFQSLEIRHGYRLVMWS